MIWRMLLLAAVVVTGFLGTGCADGIAYSGREREERYRRIMDNDARMLTDDIDLFLLGDDTSRLSPWRIHSAR